MTEPTPTPPLVDVIAEAIAEHEQELDQTACPTGYCVCSNEIFATDGDHAAHQARAVLDALTKAGSVEWGTGEGADLMTWKDHAQAERQSASATKSYDRGATWAHTNPPVVSRVIGPWTAAEG